MRASRVVVSTVMAGVATLAATATVSQGGAGAAVRSPASGASSRGNAVGFLIDEAHNGYQPRGNLGPRLHRRWSVTLDGPASYAVVVNGTVYAGAGKDIYALSAATGRSLWSVPAIAANPNLAYAGGRLFAQAGDGLEALNPSTGSLLWSNQHAVLYGPPVPGHGAVYAQSQTAPVAYSAATGEQIWIAERGGQVDQPSAPTLTGGALLADGSAFTGAWNLTSGAPLWNYEYLYNPHASQAPAYANGVSWSGINLQLRAKNGDLVGGAVSDFTPAVDHHRAMLETYDSPTAPSHLIAVDTKNGSRLWEITTKGLWATPPVISNGYVATATTNGRVTLRRESTGHEVWSASVGTTIPRLNPNNYNGTQTTFAPALAIADNTLFVPTAQGMVAYGGHGPAGCRKADCGRPKLSKGFSEPAGLPHDYAPTYLINRAHTSSQPHDDLRIHPRQVWTRPLHASATYPLVAGGKVFIRAGDFLWSLRLSNGSLAWDPVDVGTVGEMTYDHKRLFDLDSLDDALAFNADTGRRLWIKQMPYYSDSYAGPNASHGLLYASGSNPDSVVLAFNERTGKYLWEASPCNGNVNCGGDFASPALYQGDIIEAYQLSGSYRFDPRSETYLWDNGLQGYGQTSVSPAVYRGKVWAQDQVLDASTGRKLHGSTITYDPALIGKAQYALHSNGHLQARTLAGKLLWQFSGNGELQGSAVATRREVFVGSRTGTVYGLSPSSGRVLWKAQAPKPRFASGQYLTIGQGDLIVVGYNRVTAFH